MVIQDPFKGLIDGVLQGHAIATQLHQQALQDELFERRKQQDAREAQLQDLDTQMKFAQYGRPVAPGSNVVEQSTSGTLPAVVPGLSDQTYGTNYVRPVDKSRLLKAKLSDGREIQAEAYTPEEFSRRATEAAMSGKIGEFSLQQQMAEAARQHQLQLEGRPAPASLVARGLAKPGELMLPKDILSTMAQIQTLEKPQYEKVGADESLVGIPKQSPFSLDTALGAPEPAQRDELGAGTPWSPPAPREAQGPREAGQPGPLLLPPEEPLTPNQQAFVNRAKSAGQPAPTTPTTPPTLTAAFVGKPKDDKMTEDQLQWVAVHDPDPQKRQDAKAAIAGIVKSKLAARPVTNNTFTVPTAAAASAAAGKRMTLDDVPLEYRSRVQQVLEYRVPRPPDSRNNKTNQAINYYVSEVGKPDPATGKGGYSAGEFANRNAWMRSEEAGDTMKSIVAMNTLMAHSGHLWEGAQKLDNSAFQKYNTFANWLNANTGSDQAKQFNIARLGVSEELAKLLKGGVATKEEIDHWMEEINSSDSPQKLRTTIQTVIGMAHDRIQKLEEQHEAVMGAPPPQSFIRPGAQAVYDHIMGTDKPAPAAAGGNPYRK